MTVQSVIDLVFILAMIEAGSHSFSVVAVFACVVSYAVAAILIQLLIIAAYLVTPATSRDAFLHRMDAWFKRHDVPIIIWTSLVLGAILTLGAIITLAGGPDLTIIA